MCPTMRKLKYYLQIIKYEILFMVCGIRGFFEDLFAKNQCNLEWMEKLPANWNRDCVAVVTGGARGIGYEVSKLLLANGVKVVIGCRDVSKAEMLFQDYGQLAVPLALDLSDLKSVRKFAELVQAKFTKINLLINNAGIMFPEFIETKDGFESQLAINYLGHCLLVHCLLPQLKRSGDESEFDSRIVNVSSLAHRATSRKFRPEHLVQSKREWFLTAAGYADTKFAQILFTYYLQKRFHADRLPIEAVSVHPGVVNTGIFDNHYMKKMGGWAFRVLKSPEQGAYSVLYAALYQPLAKPGLFYIKNCSSKKPSSSLTYSESLQNQLFDFTTTKLLKINDFFKDSF